MRRQRRYLLVEKNNTSRQVLIELCQVCRCFSEVFSTSFFSYFLIQVLKLRPYRCSRTYRFRKPAPHCRMPHAALSKVIHTYRRNVTKVTKVKLWGKSSFCSPSPRRIICDDFFISKVIQPSNCTLYKLDIDRMRTGFTNFVYYLHLHFISK